MVKLIFTKVSTTIIRWRIIFTNSPWDYRRIRKAICTTLKVADTPAKPWYLNTERYWKSVKTVPLRRFWPPDSERLTVCVSTPTAVLSWPTNRAIGIPWTASTGWMAKGNSMAICGDITRQKTPQKRPWSSRSFGSIWNLTARRRSFCGWTVKNGAL